MQGAGGWRTRTGIAVLAVAILATLLLPLAPAQAKGAKAGTDHNAIAYALASSAQAPAPAPVQETQAERNARVALLRISPGDVTVNCGARVVFTATAEDAAGVPVGGVAVTWRAQELESGREAFLSGPGEFVATEPGTYLIVAEGAGRRAQASVTATVPAGGDAAQSAPAGGAALAATALPPPPVSGDEPRWDSTTIPALSDPANHRGGNPLEGLVSGKVGLAERPVTESGAGSSNFQLSVPLVDLAGRGLDVSLPLTYNSLVWHRIKKGWPEKDQMVFAPRLDDDWPAPGWSLGFGKVAGRVLFDADGTRHLLSGEHPNLHTTDGTFIDCRYDPDPLSTGVQCRYPDGLVIDYNHFTIFGFNYPTRITDANGNYIVVTYRDLSLQGKLPPGRRVGPPIETITDTLGRTIRFHYLPEVDNADDFSGALTAITAPGLDGSERTLVRFNWERRELKPVFADSLGVWPRTPADIRVLKAAYFPDTKTGYWFGAPDSYSTYGMLATVREHRDMVFAGAPLTEQGLIEQGRTTRQRSYNYPLAPDATLAGAPTFTTLTEWWEGMTMDPAVTTYSVTRGVVDATKEPWQQVQATLPDGTRSVARQEGFKPVLEELHGSTGQLLRTARTTWEVGDYSSPRPTRTEVAGERTQDNEERHVLSVNTFTYGPRNQVTKLLEIEQRSLDGRERLLRRTDTQYQDDTGYVERHIFDLPTSIVVYEDDNDSPVSRTELAYDGRSLAKTPGVVHHSPAFDPDAPQIWVPPPCRFECTRPCGPLEECEPICKWVCDGEGHWEDQYDPLTAFRGNVTQVTRYGEAAVKAEPIVETRTYDLVGNLVAATMGCCQATTLEYTAATQFAYPTKQTTGGGSASLSTSTTYDFSTGLVLSATDANGGTSTIESSPATLRPERIIDRTGAVTTIAYDDVTPSVTVSRSGALPGEAPGPKLMTWLNGLGLPKAEASAADGGWDVVETRYDQRGRPAQRSQPTRRTGGPDSWADAEWWNQLSYDALGRVTSGQAPDGSTVRSLYDEAVRPAGASKEPGETVRTVDAWGRWRWTRADGLGRLVEVVEPKPDGDGSVTGAGNLTTTYRFDGLGLAEVIQGEQRRRLHFDSLGRLRRQALPERSATLDAGGAYVGNGGHWSDVFTYDDRSNLTSHTDARGVKAVFNYGTDPLGRLQGVAYDISGVGDLGQPVAPAPATSFRYVTTGDLTRIDQVTINGVGAESHGYDAHGRLSATKLDFDSWPQHPMVVDYVHDSLDRLSDLHYPLDYGTGRTQRRHVHQDYDQSGRPMATKLNGLDAASEITYNPYGAPGSLKVGSGPLQLAETYAVDPGTGMPAGQRVHRGATPLLDLSYDFVRPAADGRSGQLTRLVDNLNGQKSRSYAYDAVGRLVTAAGGDPAAPRWTQKYGYDRYGNRTAVAAEGTAANGQPIPPDGLPQTQYSPTTNRITSEGWAYDAAGNVTRALSNGVWQRSQYDAAGRLARVLDDNGAVLETYVYGTGRQRLVTERARGSIPRTYYAWAGGQVISEYDQATTSLDKDKDKDKDKDNQGSALLPPRWARSTVYLGGRVLATVERPAGADQAAEVVRYHHPGRLGTQLVTNTASTEVGEQTTLPFGTALDAESTVGVNPRFTSYDRSAATGLDYAMNRYYSPGQGRFTEADPLGIGASDLRDPQSLNLYTYVGNDPINAVDPSGLITCSGDFVLDSRGLRQEGGTKCGGSTPDTYWTGAGPFGLPMNGGSFTGAGGGGSQTSRPMSLQETIYRGIGGQGTFVAGPRPTTDVDRALIGVATVYVEVLAGPALTTPKVGRSILTGLRRAFWENRLTFRASREFFNRWRFVFGYDHGWSLEHMIIKQWMYRGAKPIFAKGTFMNRVLQGLGDAGWNLVPMPASLNSALYRWPKVSFVFNYGTYPAAGYGLYHLWAWAASWSSTE